MVGSAHFDDRSFETNDEITLAVLDASTAGKLDAIFEKRGRAHRLLDRMYYLFNEVL